MVKGMDFALARPDHPQMLRLHVSLMVILESTETEEVSSGPEPLKLRLMEPYRPMFSDGDGCVKGVGTGKISSRMIS